MKPPGHDLRAYTLRDFAPEDVGEVRRVVCDTIDACYQPVYPPEAVEYFREYHSQAHLLEDAAAGTTVVLEIEGEIVATGTLVGTNVRRVFVHPSCQRQAFGKLVMRVLEDRAAAQGIRTADLSSSIVAKPFYDRLGYVTEKEDSLSVRNRRKLVYYAMSKNLDDAVLVVRADTDDRLGRFRALCERYAASLDFDLCFQGFQEEMRTLPGDYAPPLGGMFLAYCRGQAVGCVALRRLEDRIGEMKRLYVAPGHRGRGIGRALAEEAINEARRIGYQRVRLDTAPGMEDAAALYGSLGFRPIAPYYPNPIPGATYLEMTLDRVRENGPTWGGPG